MRASLAAHCSDRVGLAFNVASLPLSTAQNTLVHKNALGHKRASRQKVAPNCSLARCLRATQIAAIGATTAAIVALGSSSPVSAAISAEECISGEGPGCEAAAAESPIIRELLEKSKANRAKNDKTILEKYWAKGYGDYFSFGYNKELVKGEDGKWSLQEPNDLRTQIENRIVEMIRGRKK